MFFTDYIDINTDNKQAVERPIAAAAHHNPFLILKLNQRRSFRSLGFGSHSWFSCHGWLVCCLEGSRTLAQGRILVCLHVVSHFAEACIKEIRKVFRQMQVVKECSYSMFSPTVCLLLYYAQSLHIQCRLQTVLIKICKY